MPDQEYDVKKLWSLEGRNFVVLGTGSGIGAHVVDGLHQLGANVFCASASEKTAKKAAAIGNFPYAAADATKKEDVERVFAQAKAQFGCVNGVVDVIGKAINQPVVETGEDEWQMLYEMNLKHQIWAISIGGKACAEAGGGSIVCISSMSGVWCYPNQGAYGTYKAGLNHLVKSASLELCRKNVRVNAVAPGFTRNERLSSLIPDEKKWESLADFLPCGYSYPSDVANVVLFLSSPLAGHVNGQIISTDGGQGLTAPVLDVF